MKIPVLETERLLLRPWRVEDAPALCEYARSPEVGPDAGWKPHESLEESRKWTALWSSPELPEPIWAITEKGADVPIGSFALHADSIRQTVPNCRMLGYTLGRAYWGRGYMTEAARAVLDYAFTELHLELVSTYHFLQ